ncbi:MAG: trigger factor, partial [Clostridium sp.]
MSVQVEKLEKNMAKLTVEVSAEDFKAAIKKAFNKNKNRFAIPGFRKGKAPQAMIEKMYGEGVFYEDAADEAINASYAEAMKESGLDIVSRPEVTIEKIGKDEPFVYSALVAVKPEVTLGQYKGVEVEKADASVSAEDVEAELKKVQEQNARLLTVEDRGVEDGDQTVIDFEGFVDGKGFEGGKAEDYPLTIGSHSFIDTFEEQLIGKKIGEECEVNVTFPTEYHAADLAGKPATFKVTVKEIKVKELPELNDEFASEVSEFDTLDEYKKDVEKKLAEKKEIEANSKNEDAVVAKVVENASMEIPDKMIDAQAENMVQDMARRMQSQGLSLDMYLKYTGMTVEQMKEQSRTDAEKRIRTRLVLEE